MTFTEFAEQWPSINRSDLKQLELLGALTRPQYAGATHVVVHDREAVDAADADAALRAESAPNGMPRAMGADLDMIAHSTYGMHRVTGETDASFRGRLLRAVNRK